MVPATTISSSAAFPARSPIEATGAVDLPDADVDGRQRVRRGDAEVVVEVRTYTGGVDGSRRRLERPCDGRRRFRTDRVDEGETGDLGVPFVRVDQCVRIGPERISKAEVHVQAVTAGQRDRLPDHPVDLLAWLPDHVLDVGVRGRDDDVDDVRVRGGRGFDVRGFRSGESDHVGRTLPREG